MFERDKYEYLDNDQTDIDMAKAQAIAEKFGDFTPAEEVKDDAKS